MPKSVKTAMKLDVKKAIPTHVNLATDVSFKDKNECLFSHDTFTVNDEVVKPINNSIKLLFVQQGGISSVNYYQV